MKRFAQNQTEEPVEQSVALSPRTLLTGPRQIVRLERQYRSMADDIQNAMENLTRTKDSYVTALSNFEKASAYMRWLAPQVNSIVSSLNSPTLTQSGLATINGTIQGLIGGNQENQATASNKARTVTSQAADPGAFNGAVAGGTAGAAAAAGATPGATPTVANADQIAQQAQAGAHERAMLRQQIVAVGTQLGQFVQEQKKHYSVHKQRLTAMESQYNASKASYAKIRSELFTLQNTISTLNAGLSGWNERLSEYYMPAGEA